MCQFEDVQNAYELSAAKYDAMDLHAHRENCPMCLGKLHSPDFYSKPAAQPPSQQR